MTSQYLHPDYPNSLSTVDVGLSPLVLLAQTCDSIGKEVAPFNQKLSTNPVQSSSSSSSSSSTSPFSPSSTSSRSLLSKVTSTTQNNHGVKLSVDKSNGQVTSKAHSCNGDDDDDNDEEYRKNEASSWKSNKNMKLSRNGDLNAYEDGKTRKEKDALKTFKKKTSPDPLTINSLANHTTTHNEAEESVRKNHDKRSSKEEEGNVVVDVVNPTSPGNWSTEKGFREGRQAGGVSLKQINLKSRSKSIRSLADTPFIPAHPSKRFKKTASDVQSHSINVKHSVSGNASRKIDLRSDKGIYLKDYYGAANMNSIKKPNNLWFNNQQQHHGTHNNYFDPYSASNPMLSHQLSQYSSEYEAMMKQHSHPFSNTIPSLPPSNLFMDYYLASLYDYMLKMHLSMSTHQPPPIFPPSPQSMSATPEFDFNLKSLSNNSNLILHHGEKVKSNSSEDKCVDRPTENPENMSSYVPPWMNPFIMAQSLNDTPNPSYLQLLSLTSQQQQLQQQMQQQLQHRSNTNPFQHLLLCPFHLHPINEACSRRFSNTDELLEHVKSHWPVDNNNDKSYNNNTPHTINHKGPNNHNNYNNQNNSNNNHNNHNYNNNNKKTEFENMKFDFPTNHKANNGILPHPQPHFSYPPSIPHPFMASLFNSLVTDRKKNETLSGISATAEKHHPLFKQHLSNNVP